MAFDYGKMEEKWQARWVEAGLDKAERDDSKPKFMAIFLARLMPTFPVACVPTGKRTL